MSDENKHMDESFKKMSEQFEATYDKSFWDEARIKLENDSLDNAFREAAANTGPIAGIALASESLGDAFMDDAFREAAGQVQVAYDASFWNEMQAAEAELQMDDAFFSASKETRASYNPIYWGAANTALEQEGLHYEYNSSYWNEAKNLLDKADRRSFFTKWTAAGVILVLISFLGINSQFSSTYSNNMKPNHSQMNADDRSMLAANPNDILEGLNTAESEIDREGLNTNYDSFDAIANADNEERPVLPENGGVFIAEENNDVVENQGDEVSNNGNSLENRGETQIVENDLNPNQTSLIEGGEPEDLNEENSGVNDIDERNYINPLSNDANLPVTNHVSNELDLSVENTSSDQEVFDFVKADVQSMELALSPIELNGARIPGNMLTEITPVKRKPVHILSAIGGLGMGNSYGNNPLLLTRRFYGGLEYLRKGQGKLRNFEFGGSLVMNYSKHDNFGLDSLSERFLDNGNVERYWFKLQVHDLFYANANFLVNYRLNSKNKIKIGLGYERLIGVQSNMAYRIPQITGDKVIGDVGITTVNNNWGVTDGIKPNDFRFSLGYEYQLTRKFGVQLNVAFGLFDRSENSLFGKQSQFDNEMSGTIGLKYNLFTRVR